MKKVCIVLMLLFLFSSNLHQVVIGKSLGSFQIEYLLVLNNENNPEVEVKVISAPSSSTEFVFGLVQGGALGACGDLQSVFKEISVSDNYGKVLKWDWEGNNNITIYNGSSSDFIIKYSIDALNIKRYTETGTDATRFALFQKRRIFFIAGDVFLLPKSMPSSILVKFHLPEGVRMFSSLPEEDGQFLATTDLWGNIVYDFQKAYFVGGTPIFSLTHFTKWGDKYIYVWFDKDPASEAWLPSYGNTPWEQAEEYMKKTELFAEYYRNAIGPLPIHTVLFTNVSPGNPSYGAPFVKTNTDWFHYMQIWPKYSEPEICHHVFHQYSFSISQSKLPFNNNSSIQDFLSEGLPTYFEQILPSLLIKDNPSKGKLFEFYALNERGKKNGIGDNHYHKTYNLSAMKVYLLDRYIQKATDGKNSIVDFVKEIWNQVKDRTYPEGITDNIILNALAQVVGDRNKNYITQIAIQTNFNGEDFVDLLPDFQSYVDFMSKEFFWGNKLLFLIFLDIASAKVNEWPHYATYPHNVIRYRIEALTPFKDYLQKLGKQTLNEDDIIKAMNYATGSDHSGFFEFWKSFGLKLQPNSIFPLENWNLDFSSEEDFVCTTWNSLGTLKTEHYLSGIQQSAEGVLDNPDKDGAITIEVRLQSFDNYPPESEAINALNGDNISLINYNKYKYANLFLTMAFFKVTTSEPEHRKYDFTLTLPSFSSHPKFILYDYPPHGGLGELYFLHSLDLIEFNIELKNNEMSLPDTFLENELYYVDFGNGNNIKAVPLDKISIPEGTKSFKVYLYDKFNFLRGYKEIVIDSTPPFIALNSPKSNESLVSNNELAISGVVIDNETGINKITINGEEVSVSPNGSFSKIISLAEGLNTIKIIAIDKAGNQAEKTLSVTYKKPVQTIVIILQIGSKNFTVNGETRTLDSPPVIKNNRTLLPIRAVVEALGGTVGWDATERKVTITLSSTTIELWIGKSTAKVNGINTPIDATNPKVVPEIINGRTMLPLRFVTENLGCTVDWNGTTQTITITYQP